MVRNSTAMADEKRSYPLQIYVLAGLCGLGLASLAVGVADGWVLIAAGAAAIAISLARLHVMLDRRRGRAVPRPPPLDRAPGVERPDARSGS
jgi:hypothetical protein